MVGTDFERHHRDFVRDTLLDRQPLECPSWTSARRSIWRSTDGARQCILDQLKFPYVLLRNTVEYGVTVVQPRPNDGAGDGVRGGLVNQWANVSQRTQVIVAGTDHGADVLVEREFAIDGDAEDAYLRNERYDRTGHRDALR